MRAYNNRNQGRSNISCGYCRGAGHAITDCPHIKYDHDEWSSHRVPIKGGGCKSNRWFLSDYSYWIKQVNKYYPKWVNAQDRKKNKTKGVKRASAPKKCGFCRSEGHSRKQCTAMTTFTEQLKTANANFRQSFYDTIVKDLGLGIGAVVKLSKRKGYSGDYEEVMGIIYGFDLSSLNIFSTNNQLDSDYRGLATITVTVGNDRHNLGLTIKNRNSYGSNPRNDSKGRSIVTTDHHYWNSLEYVSTVAVSTQPIDESWATTEALANEFEWVTKKRSKEWLAERNVVELVKGWQ